MDSPLPFPDFLDLEEYCGFMDELEMDSLGAVVDDGIKPAEEVQVPDLKNQSSNPSSESDSSSPMAEAVAWRVSSNPVILSFSHNTHLNPSSCENVDMPKRRNKRSMTAATGHIVAERMRREKLSQQFIALSGLIPGLRKVDKTSVLGETIRYTKQLQERVKVLEEENSKSSSHGIAAFNNISKVFVDGEKDENGSDQQSPEIEARVCGKTVLLRAHCRRRKGLLPQILGRAESLHLTILNASVAPFGHFAIDVTIVAEVMEEEGGLAPPDLVKAMSFAL